MADAPPSSREPREPREPATTAYEFSDEHKESFRALALSMSFLGVCLMLGGGLLAVFALGAVYEGFVPNGVLVGVLGTLVMAMASWLLSGGRSLSAMMRTRGRDVESVMEAVAHLRRIFGLTLVLLMIGMLGSIALVAWCALGAGRCYGVLG